ncbi:MAG TPA: type IV toxin-antitoxin system AbiEi family antitoxin [Anaerolineae bacterium]|nr:type IV toxin-antitoxin system AbiEi family antitoxin [Anaerolineae bacterium]HQI87330.1 type IV toxin-antitoxin system AbiEi family antitoxin [Anaerolineae bacterium]
MQYAQPQGIQLLEKVLQERGPLFTVEQIKPLAEEMEISRSRLHWLLTMLAKSGWIASLKRGVYAIQKPLLDAEIPPFAIAAALVQPCAISHWSALAQHGFTTQLPVIVQASTPRKVVTPEMRSGTAHRPRGRAVWTALGVEVEFISIQEKHFFGHQTLWVAPWQQVTLTDPERTALDLIARPEIFGGLRATIEILEGALPQLDLPALVRYALRYDVGAVIKRLGWTLERLGVEIETLTFLQTYPVKTYYRLEPQLPPGKRYNSRWRIIENLQDGSNG